jgi:hypothetical protein
MAQKLPSMPSNFKVQEQAKTKQPWHKLTSRGEKKRRERDTKTQRTTESNQQIQNTCKLHLIPRPQIPTLKTNC